MPIVNLLLCDMSQFIFVCKFQTKRALKKKERKVNKPLIRVFSVSPTLFLSLLISARFSSFKLFAVNNEITLESNHRCDKLKNDRVCRNRMCDEPPVNFLL